MKRKQKRKQKWKQTVRNVARGCISALLLFCTVAVMSAAVGKEHTAKAEEYTHTCPAEGYDELYFSDNDVYYLVNPYYCYGYLPASEYNPDWPGQYSRMYIPYYSGESFLDGEEPSVGMVLDYSDIKAQRNEWIGGTFFCNIPVKMGCYRCSLCGERYTYYYNGYDEAYKAFDIDPSGVSVAVLKCTSAGADPAFAIESIQPLSEHMESGTYQGRTYCNYYYSRYDEEYGDWEMVTDSFYGWTTASQAAANPHTYTTSHICSGECYEVLHTHETIWDETEQEYTCDGTETFRCSMVQESVAMPCGHRGRYSDISYWCSKCGEYLYNEHEEGCHISSCPNYYLSNEKYRKEAHPGTHSYTHVGKRYECPHTGYTYKGYGKEFQQTAYICQYCDTSLYAVGSFRFVTDYGEGDGAWSGSASPHYYYVKEPVGGCYSYGEVHTAGSLNPPRTTVMTDCGNCGARYAEFFYDYDCSSCGERLLEKYEIGHSSCGGRYSGTEVKFMGDMIGSFEYQDISSNWVANCRAYHRTKTLTCSTAPMGDKVCDKVVTELIPLSPEQSLLAGEPVDTRAYAKFLDGHMELVECALDTYDSTKFNEWKTVILSYGTYSSVFNKTPRKASIKVYEERVDFDVSASPEDSSMGSVTGSGAYTVGTEAVVTAEPQEGYGFEGWYKDGERVSTEKEYAFAMPPENIVLVAKFTPKSFNLTVSSESAAKGTVTQSVADGSVSYKTTVAVTAEPKTGFAFLGWYHENQKLELEASDTFEMPAHDFELVAKFGADKVTVSFDSNGGTACPPKEVSCLGLYGELPVPVKSGYVFLGWMHGMRYVTADSPVEQKVNHILNAAWAKAGPDFILVDYGTIYGDNSWSRDSANIGSLELEASNLGYHLPEPSKMGYSFINWYFTENSLGNGDDLGNADNTVTKDTVVAINRQHTLHAGWKEKDYVLSFDSNGGTACSPMTITYDRPYGYHAPLPIPEKAGHTFTGWYSSSLDGNGTGTLVTDSARVQTLEDQTVYAGWSEKAENEDEKIYVKVTFNARTREQAGLTLQESMNLGYGSTIGTITSGEATRTVKYPGTYGRCSVMEELVTVELPKAVRTGYTFTGWEHNGTTVTENTEVQAAFEHTVYATYTPNQYEVTLDGQGASVQRQNQVTMTFDKKVPNVEVPEREGYQFLGYFAEMNGSGIGYYNAQGVGLREWRDTSKTVLYAYWKPQEVDVELDDRGATGSGHTKSVMMPYWEKGPDVVIPEKRGYTFLGYYTEVRGAGLQYYDATGTCVRKWTEETAGKLYAYWKQDAVWWPEEEERIEPTPLPDFTIEGILGTPGATALLYAEDYNAQTGPFQDLQPYLVYDTPVSEGAIPGTEELAFRAKLDAWFMQYRFCRQSGLELVRVLVTVPYRTQHELENEELVISDVQTKMYSFFVPKVWSYWEVQQNELYYPQKIELSNEVFQEKRLTVEVSGGSEAVPECSVVSYGGEREHVFWKQYGADGIPELWLTLEEQYIISEKTEQMPDVEGYLTILCENAAWHDKSQASVRSDSMVLDGKVLLSDTFQENGMGCKVQEDVLLSLEERIPELDYSKAYQSGIVLDASVENGAYETKAEIVYIEKEQQNHEVKRIPIADLNEVKLHTPVACYGTVEYEPGRKSEKLGEENSFFTVEVSNTGTHLSKLGYGTKEYRKALSGRSHIAEEKGILLNQVRFPFDVMLDGNNDSRQWGCIEEDCYVEKGTWVTIGKNKQQFYSVDWIMEEYVAVEFRTIAVNCPKFADGSYQTEGKEQRNVNTDWENYVATDVKNVRIKGSKEDFIITDTDDDLAAGVLAGGNQALTLKLGYSFSFLVKSPEKWLEQASLFVKPCFFWVSDDGWDRKPVKLYYKNEELDKALELEDVVHGSSEVGSWQGTFRIPAEVWCVPMELVPEFEAYTAIQTVTGREAFFVNDGFLMIQFLISGNNAAGEEYVFSRWEHTELFQDAVAAGWKYVPGDVIRYDLTKSILDDYEVGGVE